MQDLKQTDPEGHSPVTGGDAEPDPSRRWQLERTPPAAVYSELRAGGVTGRLTASCAGERVAVELRYGQPFRIAGPQPLSRWLGRRTWTAGDAALSESQRKRRDREAYATWAFETLLGFRSGEAWFHDSDPDATTLGSLLDGGRIAFEAARGLLDPAVVRTSLRAIAGAFRKAEPRRLAAFPTTPAENAAIEALPEVFRVDELAEDDTARLVLGLAMGGGMLPIPDASPEDLEETATLRRRAGERLAAGDPGGAEALLGDAISRAPKDALLRLERARTLRGDPARRSDAISELSALLAIDAGVADAWLELAMALVGEGRTEEARECFDRAIAARVWRRDPGPIGN